MKIDNGTGGSREASTGGMLLMSGDASQSTFFAELKPRTIWVMESADVKFEIGDVLFVPSFAAKE